MVNVFAVILEATLTHKSQKSEKFVVSPKLADLSSKSDKDGVVPYISLVCFARNLMIYQSLRDAVRSFVYTEHPKELIKDTQKSQLTCFSTAAGPFSTQSLFHPQKSSSQECSSAKVFNLTEPITKY
jgi:hypothetical protein